MTYQLLADSCDEGPCPTFFVDPATGDVIVQGYHTPEKPGAYETDEGFLHIPAQAWQKLITRLPR